ncbi:hypothetical protein ICL81_10345 [Leucobacter sp. cx-328]|uniref:hypothetical protein n=1 Tax=unclassified Leucobacter TaxID=2621730 RepID=UPI00165E5C0F|nr:MULTISPECIES: hypothetical protein [unclassified Leucobacter]MBC9944904.1 hypothetical protein [Leucobacter sp. cx-328]
MYPTPTFKTRKSVPPRIADWPIAQQYAERLRGTVVACGPGFRLASWPDVPATRITALSRWLISPRYIAVHMTAAWIWGACYQPGEPTVLTRGGRISSGRERSGATYRIGRIAESEIHTLAGFSVSTPLRTAYDLLRTQGRFDTRERAAVRLLAFGRLEELRARASRCSPSEGKLIRTRLEALYGAARPLP